MERKLASAIEKTAPNEVRDVLSRCEVRKGTVIHMTSQKTTKRRWSALIAACFALMLIVGGGVFFSQHADAVASVVSLDVNPSIELKVNKNKKVIVCTPLNDDAKTILADMGNGADLKGAKLDVAVNAIVGSLARHGYLSSISSALMISVEDKDIARAENLQRELISTVDHVLQTNSSRASVLTQTIKKDSGLEQQARDNNISTGKAALINRVLALNSSLKFEELATLSVGELKDLMKAGAPAMPIGKKNALDIAASEFSKVSSSEILYSEVDSEIDESPAHYEVEIVSRDREKFEYKIDAYTGAILKSKREPADEEGVPSNPEQPDIGYAKAKAIAMEHAGVSADSIYDLNIKMDFEDGVLVYEIEFKSGDIEYEYEIDAASGEILESERETDTLAEEPSSKAELPEIGSAKAEAIALEHAGVSADNACDMNTKKDREGDVSVYEIQFRCDDVVYAYEIDAVSGAILDHDTEENDAP